MAAAAAAVVRIRVQQSEDDEHGLAGGRAWRTANHKQKSADDGELDELGKPKHALDLDDEHDFPHAPYPTDDLAELPPLKRLRQWIYMTLDVPTFSSLAKGWNLFIMVLIAVSVIALVVETIPDLESWAGWYSLEYGVVMVFTAEYGLKFLAAKRRFRWALHVMNIIDLLAILPFYIELAVGDDETSALRVLRVVRLARVFRLFKTSSLRVYLVVFVETMKRSSDAFGLIVSLILLAVIVFSTMEFFAEKGAILPSGDPTPFTSIPAAMYWAVVTMTTIGYGDMYPVTVSGRLIAMVTALCGLMVLAFPVIIIGANFENVYQEFLDQKRREEEDGPDEEDDFRVATPSYMQHLQRNQVEIATRLFFLERFLQSDPATWNEADGQRLLDNIDVLDEVVYNRHDNWVVDRNGLPKKSILNFARSPEL